MVIPPDFENKLYRTGTSSLQMQDDAINGMTAGLISAYTWQIINGFNREILTSSGTDVMIDQVPANIDIAYSFWYNQ